MVEGKTPISQGISETEKPVSALALNIVALDGKVEAIRVELHVRAEALRVALQLQAAEYARRLEELNHVQARNKEFQGSYLPREIFYQSATETSVWRSRIEKALSDHLLDVQSRYVLGETFREYVNQDFIWRTKIEDTLQTNRVYQLDKYVQKETYGKSEEDLRAWRLSVDKVINEGRGKDNGKAIVWGAIASTIAIVISMVTMLVTLYKLSGK